MNNNQQPSSCIQPLTSRIVLLLEKYFCENTPMPYISYQKISQRVKDPVRLLKCPSKAKLAISPSQIVLNSPLPDPYDKISFTNSILSPHYKSSQFCFKNPQTFREFLLLEIPVEKFFIFKFSRSKNKTHCNINTYVQYPLQRIIGHISQNTNNIQALNISSPYENSSILTLIKHKNLINLQYLKIHAEDNRCPDTFCQTFAYNLGKLVQLMILKLNLQECGFTNFGISKITDAISKLSNLERLSLKFELNVNMSIINSNFLEQLQNLKYLSLSFNMQKQILNCIEQLFVRISSLEKLTGLKLFGQFLCATDCIFLNLGQSLKNLINLQKLDLFFPINDITNSGVDLLCSSFQNLKELKDLKLNLQCNKLTPNCIIPLKHAIKDLKYLSKIDLSLSNNNLGDEDQEFLNELALQGHKIIYIRSQKLWYS